MDGVFRIYAREFLGKNTDKGPVIDVAREVGHRNIMHSDRKIIIEYGEKELLEEARNKERNDKEYRRRLDWILEAHRRWGI